MDSDKKESRVEELELLIDALYKKMLEIISSESTGTALLAAAFIETLNKAVQSKMQDKLSEAKIKNNNFKEDEREK